MYATMRVTVTDEGISIPNIEWICIFCYSKYSIQAGKVAEVGVSEFSHLASPSRDGGKQRYPFRASHPSRTCR